MSAILINAMLDLYGNMCKLREWCLREMVASSRGTESGGIPNSAEEL